MGASERLEGESSIIAEFLAPLTDGDPGAAGLVDDCAVLTLAPAIDLVVTTDSLLEGVHFLPGDIPSFKALAVNVSDLIAKGATPERYLLNLALPEPPTRAFITRLAEGLAEAQQTFGCHLIGGDTDRTPGPFTLTITAIGSLPAGSAVRRTTARPGDVIAVTGTIGDAGLGLALRKDPKRARQAGLSADHAAFLISRFEKPVPRLAAAALVRDFATAAMDVSDGLAKDLAHMASASGTGANIKIDKVPLSEGARIMCTQGFVRREDLIASGEDYEVLFTLSADRWPALQSVASTTGVPVTALGMMTQDDVVIWRDSDGRAMPLTTGGWDHF